jgi:hypothetical protein
MEAAVAAALPHVLSHDNAARKAAEAQLQARVGCAASPLGASAPPPQRAPSAHVAARAVAARTLHSCAARIARAAARARPHAAQCGADATRALQALAPQPGFVPALLCLLSAAEASETQRQVRCAAARASARVSSR